MHALLFLIAITPSPAFAEEAEEAEEAASAAAPEAPPVSLPPAPAEMGPLTPKRLMALRTYKAQRLQVRAETEYRGSSTATFTSMSYGYPHGLGTGVIMTDPVQTYRTWGVYRGPQRLSSPDFLTLAGPVEKRDALVADIKKAKSTAKGWYLVAGSGVAAIVAGLAGMSMADSFEQYSQYNTVSLIGTTVTIGGLLGASFPASKGSRLYRYPGNSMTVDQANSYAHIYNEKLRNELKIQPQEAWLLDLGAEE